MPDKKKQKNRDVKSKLENITGQDLVNYFDQHHKKWERTEIRDVPLSEWERIVQTFQNLCLELGNLKLMKEEPWKKH